MTVKTILAAALLSATAIGFSAPAHALTGNQYASQGEGVYTTSKGVPEGYYRHHRGYDPGYQYRRVYRAPPVYVPNDEDDFDPDSVE